MIERIRIGDNMLDPIAPGNPGEAESGVKIICATGPEGVSEDRRSVSYQISNKFKVPFGSQTSGEHEGEIGSIFETSEFNFGRRVRANAYAIVCHRGGDMTTQDYSVARIGLSKGLQAMHNKVAISGRLKDEIFQEHLRIMHDLDRGDTDRYLAEQERIIRETRLTLNPLLRIPLMATNSPEDCADLFGVMEASRANLVVYMLSQSRDLVEATLIKFPNLGRSIRAFADEELKLAA